MDKDKIKQILQRVPWGPISGLVVAYLAYGFYTFNYDSESELFKGQAEHAKILAENEGLQNSIKEANEFLQKLEGKKVELRNMHNELEGLKATLSETIDQPAFIKTVITEAKRVKLTVLGIQPEGDPVKKEYYGEQAFSLKFRGVYGQLLVFLDRLAQSQRIVRVDNFDVKPIGSSLSKYVELEGTVQIKTYFYLGSKVDEIAKAGGSVSTKPKPRGGG